MDDKMDKNRGEMKETCHSEGTYLLANSCTLNDTSFQVGESALVYETTTIKPSFAFDFLIDNALPSRYTTKENGVVDFTLLLQGLDGINDSVDKLVFLYQFIDEVYMDKDFSTARQLIEMLLDNDYSESYLRTVLRMSKPFREHDDIKFAFDRGLDRLRSFGSVY